MKLSLGLAQWSTAQWRGQLFSQDEEGRHTLRQYSSVFNAVEGNTTFYALPKEETVSKWKEEATPGFEFCFKLPQNITHRGTLDSESAELTKFFRRIEPLEEHIGPLMLQLPANMGGTCLPALARFLDGLPSQHTFSLEVRSPVFFEKGEEEKQLNRMLAERGIDRTSLDSRALFSAPADSEAMIDAQQKKPRLPVHAIATGSRPMVRFIGRMEEEQNAVYWQPWLKKVAQWLEEGKEPIVFIHTPDNLQAPIQARTFYQQLAKQIALPPLPPFPAENIQQDDLFG
ncbi:DUF72 domain-containing protein [Sansalvadorimonas verongulae]|uniref:DUF72 domain-containing protein n=1 Tax=Sansalvadorimonas verongulae TaxID=2172824 RepID=UPI0012BCA0C7|nr:DUF72 domain-containing protein [Sansalvadorimonas verongulae]MTI14702.1 DUF72 domain-containing protein [Sansalvadorimonas verongulae]